MQVAGHPLGASDGEGTVQAEPDIAGNLLERSAWLDDKLEVEQATRGSSGGEDKGDFYVSGGPAQAVPAQRFFSWACVVGPVTDNAAWLGKEVVVEARDAGKCHLIRSCSHREVSSAAVLTKTNVAAKTFPHCPCGETSDLAAGARGGSSSHGD